MTSLRTVLCAAALLAVAVLPVPAAAQGPAVPAAVPLDRGWEFKGAGDPRFRPVRVPHVVDRSVDKASFPGTVSRYRLRFTAPPAVEGFDWAIRFEQVRRIAEVTLNGRVIGTHRDPYVPFELPATSLRPGERNELLVTVDNRKGREPREGWWNWGGITRDVLLVPKGRVELKENALLPVVTCEDGGCRAEVLFDGVLLNRGEVAAEPRVELSLDPPGEEGEPVTSRVTARTLAPGESTRVRHRFAVPDPRLWSPENPQRYVGTTRVRVGDAPTAHDVQRVGLREVRVRGGMLELNGRQLNLRGSSIQEDVRGRGPALTAQDIARTVSELKEVGANITRAHYLLNPRLLDALDAAGILVWSQAPIYHRDRLLETQVQRLSALSTVRRTVLEARRHPSVITHSVANELSASPNENRTTAAFLRAAYPLVKDLDPTLPVSVDLLSYPGFPRQRAYAEYDLLGINSYFGWYPGKKDRSTANIRDLGPYLDRMRRMYDRQALVVTEFGAESTFRGPASVKETYAFQARYVRSVLQTIAERPFIGGAIYWTLQEFAVKPDWDGGAKRDVPRDAIHNKGLITYTGDRKPAWDVARSLFRSTPLYRDVTPAEAAGLPQGASAGGPGPLLLVMGGILAFLALDLWALLGILRARRRRRAGASAPSYGVNLTVRTSPSRIT